MTRKQKIAYHAGLLEIYYRALKGCSPEDTGTFNALIATHKDALNKLASREAE